MSIWTGQHFSGKTVVVTGGTGGIGLALARAFSEAGASVTATGATAAELDLARPGAGNIALAELDVRRDDSVRALADGYEKLDVLVNCAGVNLRAAELTPEGFSTVVDINLNGSMRTSYALREKLAGGGTILNLASMFSFFGAPHAPGYAASKGGVVQLTKSLAVAFAADGIRVNALAPGWIETPMTAAPRANPARNAELMARTPMGRWGTPGDLVGPALFLCSPMAAFVTGAILPVDGGYSVV